MNSPEDAFWRWIEDREAVCGVIGLWRPRRVDDDDSGVADRRRANALLHRIRHRGPDGRAVWHHLAADAVVTLGLARLAIVAPDTDAAVAVDYGGRSDDVIAAVTNGELYNHLTLRRSLGPACQYDVDTALVPTLFRAHGPAWAAAARGMFGTIIAARGRLHLCRDPLGKKPLYYRRHRDGWVVASEQKALFGGDGHDDVAVVDPARAVRAFSRGFLEDDEPLLADVWQVPPGGHVVLSAQGATVTRAVAFDDVLTDRRAHDDSLDGDVERFEALLHRATARRARTAVPTRVLLSGGMDAAVILGHADDVDATTLQMPGPRDETPRARRVARRLGRAHHVVTPAPPDRQSLRRVLWHTEVPDVAASWEMGSALLEHAAAMSASGVRVVLSGEGADELFLGYPWLRLDAGVLRGRRHDELARAWTHERLRAPQERAFVRWRAMHEATIAVAIDDALPRLFPPHSVVGLAPPTTTTMTTTTTPHRARELQLEALRRDMHTLPVLHADRLWMACGVEARLPFLDVDVVRAALRLPSSSLLSTRTEKPLVRQLFSRALSRPAPPKQGFSGARRPDDATVLQLVDGVLARGPRVVAGAALKRLRQGSADWRVVEVLWRVVVLEECADVLGGGGPG